MATREKTVVYTMPMTTTDINDNTLTNLTQTTIYIPESSPTFTSVYVEWGWQDRITATGGTIASWSVGLSLGGAGYTTHSNANTLTNSGENIAGVMAPYDFTSHFNTNWSGTSKTLDFRFQLDHSAGTTLGLRNVTMVIYITYQYDDTAATQLKTAIIPLESLVSELPTTLGNFGSSQIPQLTGVGGFLPENGIVIRDWFILLEANEASNNTTDYNITARINTGTTTTFTQQESGLATSRFARWVYHPADEAPSAGSSHNLQLAASTTNRCNHLVATLYVTYEFTLSGTSRILNSVILPLEISSFVSSGNESTLGTRAEREFIITEPGTITQKHCAVRLHYSCTSVSNPRIRSGAQAFRTYTSAGGFYAGMSLVQQRIDGGSAQGAALTLDRGINLLNIDLYYSTTVATNISGYFILNYLSDVPSQGVGAASHTVLKSIKQFEYAGTTISSTPTIDDVAFPIVESNYWIHSIGFILCLWGAGGANALTVQVQKTDTEGAMGDGYGWQEIYSDLLLNDLEMGVNMVWMRGRDSYRKFPQDSPSLLDPEAARLWKLSLVAVQTGWGLMSVITYSGATFTVAGTISGNDAALPTEVNLHRSGKKEFMQTQTLSAGTTAFSFTVYDDSTDYFIEAYQDATHVGRSALARAA